MDEALATEKSKGTPNWLGYSSGNYSRTRVTRVGKIALRVPRDRAGRFRTAAFEGYQRGETALVMAMMGTYLRGVSAQVPAVWRNVEIGKSRILSLMKGHAVPEHFSSYASATGPIISAHALTRPPEVSSRERRLMSRI